MNFELATRRAQCGKTISRVITTSLMLTLIQLAGSVAVAKETITLAGDPWPPYAEGELGHEATGGIAVDLVRMIFERIDDVDVSFPMIPWKRALREVEMGTMDGIPILLRTEERSRYMVFSEPLFEAAGLVWYSRARRPAGFEWRTLDDLSKVRVGVIRGYNYAGPVGVAIDKGELQVTAAPSAESLFAMLVSDRIDVVLAGNSVGNTQARKFPDLKIVPAEKPTSIEIYRLGLSRRSKATRLLPQINEILDRLKLNGTVDRLLEHR